MVALLESKKLLDQFISEHWPNGATADGQKLLERYRKIYDRYKESGGTVDAPEQEEEETEAGTTFAYEEHLRDYLAENLHILEPGLALWPVGPNTDAVEFPVDGRRIDILAKDAAGLPVIIELKVSKGHERTIGQCLYYRAKVREMFNTDRARIFIIAAEMSQELRLATKEIQDVTLFEYSLSMTVNRI